MVALREDRRFRENRVPRSPLQDDHAAIRLVARQLDRSLKNQEQTDDGIAPMKQEAAFGQATLAGGQGLKQARHMM